MKVAGFSIIRNAVKYDFPVLEAIRSVLPLCDAFYLLLGDSDDDTNQYIRKNIDSPKMKYSDSVWDATKMGMDGIIIGEETNKALDKITKEYDWCFYLQSDECIHEKDYDTIRAAMETHLHTPQVEGLLFKYYHFYGSYRYIATTHAWYHHEIRLIKNNKGIRSFHDGQGFRTKDNRKLKVKMVDAHIYHYGWVREPEALGLKRAYQHKVHYGEDVPFFHLANNLHDLKVFDGTHPTAMTQRVAEQSWEFEFDEKNAYVPFKYRLKKWVKRWFGIDVGVYKNYTLLK